MIPAMLALAITAAPAPYEPEIFRMPDGLEVALVRTPGGSKVSVRVVVRVGAAQDPFGKDGLAHLLEHLVLSSAYGESPEQARDRWRAHGLQVSSFTAPDLTSYILDGPREGWAEHAGRFLDAVTNPALSFSNLATELGVVDSEAVFFNSRTLMWATDLVLFPGNKGREPVLGSKSTRQSITTRDLMDLYGKYYVPPNSTVIVVGDVERAEVEVLLSAHVHWPPSVPSELPWSQPEEINVPVDEKVPSRASAVVFGYEVPSLDPVVCDDIAALLELRLKREIIGERALASEVNVECGLRRGHRLLVAFALSAAFEGGVLPDVAAKAFESIAKRPITKSERVMIQERFQARLSGATAFSLGALVADAFVHQDEQERRRLAKARLRVPELDGRAIREGAAAFVPRRRIQLHLTP